MKIGNLVAILKRFNILKLFLQNYDFFIVRTCILQISSQNSGGKVGFLEGFHPLGTNGSKSTLVTEVLRVHNATSVSYTYAC